jgi:hypothetical protein
MGLTKNGIQPRSEIKKSHQPGIVIFLLNPWVDYLGLMVSNFHIFFVCNVPIWLYFEIISQVKVKSSQVIILPRFYGITAIFRTFEVMKLIYF